MDLMEVPWKSEAAVEHVQGRWCNIYKRRFIGLSSEMFRQKHSASTTAHLRVDHVLEAAAAYAMVAGEHNPSGPLSGTFGQTDRALQLVGRIVLGQLPNNGGQFFFDRPFPLVGDACQAKQTGAVGDSS